MNNCYVYMHIRLDTNKPFYIGKGTYRSDENSNCNYLSRAYDKNHRNDFWKRVISKTDYIIKIVDRDISQEQAFELEEFLIDIIGRRHLGTGTLVNLSNGGEGCTGERPSIQGGKSHHARPVMQLSMDNKVIAKFECIEDAMKSMNAKSHGRIQQCCSGKPYDKRGFSRKSAYGFKWQYV